MIIGIQGEILKIYAMGLLGRLLEDKTTKSDILWATDAYQNFGDDYRRDKEIKPYMITGANSAIIKNRARKELEQQTERTKQHAEVFTPLWVCQKMIDHADEMWFNRANVFFVNGRPTEKVEFPKKRKWQHYVDSRRLEITCGEAPFLATRYDVLTGEVLPLDLRLGILDRKLRIVNENAADEKEWLTWAVRAYQATYGYEFQGDSLLIARLNLLMTFEEYFWKRWGHKPDEAAYKKIANIIAWNIWQMDGLTGKIPYCSAQQRFLEADLFASSEADEILQPLNVQPPCRIYDWRRDNSLEFLSVNKGGSRNMKFDFIIGNPPYQETMEGTSDRPIYNEFMDAVYKVSDKVELITPARFLFNAGKTPKAWNNKMLNDTHFKVLLYEEESKNIFNTDIKGGIVITYYDKTKNFDKIGIFIRRKEMQSIVAKIINNNVTTMNEYVYAPESYRFSEDLHIDLPEIKGKSLLSKGHDYDLTTNIFDKLDDLVFFAQKPQDKNIYIKIIGRKENKRTYRYIKKDYIESHSNLDKWKVILAKANGTGDFGEVMATPFVGEVNLGHTQSFISIGAFTTKYEAESLVKYIKTKFLRSLLGIFKVTQDNKASVWQYVPLQDFTDKSDIDWSKSIAEIDKQLYKKYGLDDKEIEFIETHVKEMA